jgi:hypothetical protein
MREWQALHGMKKYTFADYGFQFITVTAGVLIALLIDGLVDWNSNRELVAAAHASIAREVADNLKEMEGLPKSIASASSDIDNCLKFANDLLAKGKTDVSSLNLNFSLATLNSSSWLTADRTGALSHMSYGQVKEYAELYKLQELFDTVQRRGVDMVADSMALVTSGSDPTQADRQELMKFRDQLMRYRASLFVTENLGTTLTKAYKEFQPVK